MNKNELVEALISASDTRARLFLLEGNSEILHVDIVYALKEQADKLERDDARRALEIGQIAQEVAEYLNDNEARAVALWMQANAQDFLADLESAVQCYERATELFNAAGKNLEAARTSIGQMSTLMKLGQFKQAQSLAEAARLVFIAHQDMLSLAKVDMNLGSVHYQQGQYALALKAFEHATEAFQSLGESLYAAMNQINQASMLMLLDDFLGAEALHEKARPIFLSADLRTAVASVDHDLAVLQYARGDYTNALHTFESARDIFTGVSDQVNIAMTDLEESDLYLDLNLPEETLRLSEKAGVVFAEAGMTFELARVHTNHAVALARLGQGERAVILLEDAHELFVKQGNKTWSAHTLLQQAEITGQGGQYEKARILANKAINTYESLGMKTKQAYAHIISANLWADESNWVSALQELETARHILGELAVPWLEQRIYTCFGRVFEGMGEKPRAIEYYQKAATQIEQMTTAITAEEHRTAFVANKLIPYEGLVTLYGANDPLLSFQWAEQAKSRVLVDMLVAGVHPKLHIDNEKDAQQVNRLQIIREELNWLYTRLTRGTASGESTVPAAGPDTWIKVEEREREAITIWRDLQARHAEELSLIRTTPLTPSDIQTDLAEGTILVEYFITRNQVMAFVVSQDKTKVYPNLISLDDLLPLLESLAFQFSKFQYGTTYYIRHRAALLKITQDILSQLGQKLITPLWGDLSAASAIVFVPHGPLHTLPFHALRPANRYLIETHAVSYAPSAAVLKFCWNKANTSAKHAPVVVNPLLVGVPDERASHVSEEIQSLASLFDQAKTLVGEQATFENFQQAASVSGLVHIASHGLFRPEAPLLSSIRLADQWLAVQDIYNLNLDNASLVTLSACETGLGHDAGGDDLVGLVRGFLHAGANSLVVSLWAVDDESMIYLVKNFYMYWLAGKSKNQALRDAQLDMLIKYEHPFYWAPLALVGNEK